ncbi:hypothetical protein AgCh_000567 [Apium graveolens]
MHDDDLIEDETVQILKRRKIIEESKTTSDTAQVVQNEEQQVSEETINSDQFDLKKMTIADKKKLLWKKSTPAEPKSNLMINQLATFGLRAKQPRDRARLDAHDKDNPKEKLILYLNDGLTYRLADTDVLKKFVRELQYIHYLLEVKSDVTRRWSEYILKAIRDLLRIYGTKTSQYIPMITEGDGREIHMLKNSAKVEVILKGRCLCYNENSSHPRVIRLGDGLERTSIQALRTAIYQIGDSKDEELMQVKAQKSRIDIASKTSVVFGADVKDADMEDYGFEYSDEEQEEQDVDIENQYYNSKVKECGRRTYKVSGAAGPVDDKVCHVSYEFKTDVKWGVFNITHEDIGCLWKKSTPAEPKSNLMINQLATFGLRAKQPRDRARLDAHDKDNPKEKLILYLNDGLTYRLADTDVLKKFVRELQYIHYLLEVKSDVTRRWSEYILKAIRDLLRIYGTKTSQYIPMITEGDGREIHMLKNSAKVEVILKGRCLCYNENSSHPRVIRLGDGLERTSIQALRTAIYQIGDCNNPNFWKIFETLMNSVFAE